MKRRKGRGKQTPSSSNMGQFTFIKNSARKTPRLGGSSRHTRGEEAENKRQVYKTAKAAQEQRRTRRHGEPMIPPLREEAEPH